MGTSRARDITNLDTDPMPQTGAATGQTGGLVSVSGSDHDVPRQDRGRRIAAILAAHGAHRAHLVSHVGDRSAKTRKPGTPLLALIRLVRAVRLAAEGEDVLAHELLPVGGAGAVRRPLPSRQPGQRRIDNGTPGKP